MTALLTTSSDLAEALRPALLRVSRRLRQEAAKVGVSVLDAMLLNRIERQPGVGVCDLADQEQITRPTMSSHIKRLTAIGWVARQEDVADGRRSGLAITPSGRSALDTIRKRRNDWLAARLALLPEADRVRLADAASILQRLTSLEP